MMTYALIADQEIMYEHNSKIPVLNKWRDYEDPAPMRLVKIEKIRDLRREWH